LRRAVGVAGLGRRRGRRRAARRLCWAARPRRAARREPRPRCGACSVRGRGAPRGLGGLGHRPGPRAHVRRARHAASGRAGRGGRCRKPPWSPGGPCHPRAHRVCGPRRDGRRAAARRAAMPGGLQRTTKPCLACTWPHMGSAEQVHALIRLAAAVECCTCPML